ncbi:MAG: DUF2007 domain-containing protein [Pseudomonadota bacterium]
MKILERTHNLVRARVIVSYLQAADIDAVLLDAEMGAMLPVAGGGVRIAVPEEQAYRARLLLEEADKSFDVTTNE